MKKTKDKVKTDWSFNEALRNLQYDHLMIYCIKLKQSIVKILKIIKFK